MEVLMRKADATFLWVALVLKELEDADPWNVLELAEAVPATLTALYRRMRDQLSSQSKKTTALCKSVVRGIVLAQRPLTLVELSIVAGLSDQESHTNENYLPGIVQSCGSFVDIRGDTCYLVHQSAKDFFLEPEADSTIFEDGLANEHEQIVCRSLDAMIRLLTRDDMFSLLHPGSPPPDIQTIRVSPLWPIRYSCSFWVFHLKESLGDTYRFKYIKDTMVAQTYDFLEEKVLRWVEALANLSQVDIALTSLQDLELICAVSDTPVPKLILYSHRTRKQKTCIYTPYSGACIK
jgi:hypothetical protein